jgi:cytochrome c peroxidase
MTVNDPCRFGALLLLTICACVDLQGNEPDLRRPIAIHRLSADRVVTANRNGTLSVVDLASASVVREDRVGKQLSDCQPLVQESFVATDEAAHEVLLLSLAAQDAKVAARQRVSPYPVSVRVSSDGRRAAVASLWSRRLTLLRIGPASLAIEREVDLPFAPRQQMILPGDKQAIVFDSYGGRFAVVELATGNIVLQRDFPGHAVRGLVLSPDGKMLLASHQMLNPDAHVNRSDIHWGLLMSNDLRWMKLTSLLDPNLEIYAGGRVHPLGVPDRGGGDPAGTAMTRDGTVVVCLGGVNQVMIGTQDDLSLTPVSVGKRPTALALSSDQRRAVVANTFDDTLSVVDIAEKRVVETISLGATKQRSLVERGEELFHDARFSHEGWMSCHSCHTDGHSNFTRNDNLSDNSFGAPKLVMSLLGRKDTAPFAWSGDVPDLPSQIRNSIHKTMQSDREQLADDEVAALAAYIESLPSPPSMDELRGTADRAAIDRGQKLFAAHDCARCHAPPAYTSAGNEEVGLQDERGELRFNPPPLLGVGQRDALFHDGRAKSLSEVFSKHHHPDGANWSDDDVQDLVAFLRSL